MNSAGKTKRWQEATKSTVSARSGHTHYFQRVHYLNFCQYPCMSLPEHALQHVRKKSMAFVFQLLPYTFRFRVNISSRWTTEVTESEQHSSGSGECELDTRGEDWTHQLHRHLGRGKQYWLWQLQWQYQSDHHLRYMLFLLTISQTLAVKLMFFFVSQFIMCQASFPLM